MADSLWRGNLAHMAWLVKFWILFTSICAYGALEPLPLRELRDLQKGACVLVHPWAAWCSQCVEELPELLPRFAAWQGVQVLVIDLSPPFTQENFSKRWAVLREARFATYFRPSNQAPKTYARTIDSAWDGSMPYSVLYSRGKKLGSWNGRTDFNTLSQNVKRLCP